jgi:hypothetical protein
MPSCERRRREVDEWARPCVQEREVHLSRSARATFFNSRSRELSHRTSGRSQGLRRGAEVSHFVNFLQLKIAAPLASHEGAASAPWHGTASRLHQIGYADNDYVDYVGGVRRDP